jgi:V-type H+-transporting ATPase subunit H
MLRLLNSHQKWHDKLLQLICSILAVGKVAKHPNSCKQVLDYCVNNLRSPSSPGADYIKGLSFLLRSNEIRDMFAEKGATSLLTERIIGSSTDVQLQYTLGFCLWMLSFSDATMLQLLENNAVAKLHDILKNYKKEKCCRIAVTTLTNFLKYQDKQDVDPTVLPEGYVRRNIYSEMVSLGVLRTLQVLSKRNFADQDVVPLIESLIDKLQQRIEDTSSFGDYKQEVLSGRLEWTPVHKSEKFWKENIKEFESDNFYILKELATILQSSKDPKVQCIALHDFGEFVRHHTQGRKVLTTLNIKPRIIQLLEDQNEDVKKEALLCTQKLMVKKWEFLA